MYLNVGCVCVSVCVWVTEAGRDLFMHNKLIWLIIEDVWNLFAFTVASLSGKGTFTAPKKVHLAVKVCVEDTDGPEDGPPVPFWSLCEKIPQNFGGFIRDSSRY